MKSMAKQRQQIEEKAKDLNSMLLYVLGELHKNEGFGGERLRRNYDSVLLEMYKDVSYTKAGLTSGVGDSYAVFAREYGLTFEAYMERQKEAIEAFTEEFAQKVEETRQARLAWLQKERERNGGNN